MRLSGRRALVTGASRGIGAALARRLASEGAQVAVVARTATAHPTLPGSLATTVETLAGRGHALCADLSDPEARAGIVPAAVAALGGDIDILVNNAAAAMYAPVRDYPLRRRQRSFEVNVHAPLDLAQAVLPAMIERGQGWIVNVSSATAQTDGQRAPAPMTVYGASKAALDRITVGLADDLAGTGVRVNSIRPRAAVLSEGALALVADRLRPDQIESMEAMVSATLALCDCAAEQTGGLHVSLELLEAWGVEVRSLDGHR